MSQGRHDGRVGAFNMQQFRCVVRISGCVNSYAQLFHHFLDVHPARSEDEHMQMQGNADRVDAYLALVAIVKTRTFNHYEIDITCEACIWLMAKYVAWQSCSLP